MLSTISKTDCVRPLTTRDGGGASALSDSHEIGSSYDRSRPDLRQPFQDDRGHRHLDEADGDHGQGFVMGRKAAVAAPPRKPMVANYFETAPTSSAHQR